MRNYQFGKIGFGLTILALACGGSYVDIINNHAFGIKRGDGAALAMIIAAVGVPALPGAAVFTGWKPWNRVVFAMCVFVTFLAALSYYAERSGETYKAAEGQKESFERQERRREALTAEDEEMKGRLADISERRPAASLKALMADAQTRIDAGEKAANSEATDARKGATCGSACRKAEAARDAAILEKAALAVKLAEAETRETMEAKRREIAAMIAAIDGGRIENVEPDFLAAMVAPYFGVEAHPLSTLLQIILIVALILLTIGVASLAGYGISLIRDGITRASDGGNLETVGEAQALGATGGAEVSTSEPISASAPVQELEKNDESKSEAVDMAAAKTPEPLGANPSGDPGEWIKSRLREKKGGSIAVDKLFELYRSETGQDCNKNLFSRRLTACGFGDRGRSGNAASVKNVTLVPGKLSIVR